MMSRDVNSKAMFHILGSQDILRNKLLVDVLLCSHFGKYQMVHGSLGK